MTWDEKSPRRDGLPRWWPVTVKRILKRDPVCKCPGCIKCAAPMPGMSLHGRCIRASHDVDHVDDRDNHKDTNLRGLCAPCHAKRSSDQGNAAKAAKAAPQQFGQPAEPHPGKL